MDFIFRGPLVKSAQKLMDTLSPKVNIHVPEEAPIPSLQLLKSIAPTISKINSLEESLGKLSDDQLRAKTPVFKARYQEAIKKEKDEYDRIEAQYKSAIKPDEKETIGLELDTAHSNYK